MTNCTKYYRNAIELCWNQIFTKILFFGFDTLKNLRENKTKIFLFALLFINIVTFFIIDLQTTGTFISPTVNMVSVVMVYNSFEVTERKLQSYINVTAHLDICFIPVTQLYTAKKKCRLNICIPSINPPINPTKVSKGRHCVFNLGLKIGIFHIQSLYFSCNIVVSFPNLNKLSHLYYANIFTTIWFFPQLHKTINILPILWNLFAPVPI